jgi:peptidoglycan-associated lipoprotein
MRIVRPLMFLAWGIALIATQTGCAKRPAVPEVAAPAPTGVAAPVAPPTVPAPAPRPEAFAQLPPVAAPPALTPSRPRPEEFVARPELTDAHFDFDRSEIRPDDARILDRSAAWLVEHPGDAVLIEGHCDERGTNAYNLALGDRRAQATRDYLVARGVALTRFVTISYGEERPVCSERAEACWWKNRRAHLLVKPQ